MVTVNDLRVIAGAKSAAPMMEKLATAFNKYAAAYEVTTQKRIAQFLANVCHETGGFKVLVESLNYTPDGLMETFSRARISEADAKRLGRTKCRKADQQAIANTIYGGAWGKKNLGNTEPNDGWDFRGSGPGQVTGRANFARVEKETGIPVVANPDLLRDPDTGMQAALALWQRWGLNELADADQTDAIRKRWNGGTLGLNEVKAALTRSMRLSLKVERKAAPMPAPAVDLYDGKPHDEIRAVQVTLNDIGYPEVGTIDAKWGTKTAASVLAFRLDNGLQTADPRIDGEFLAKLALRPQRPIAEARANATVSDLRAKDDDAIRKSDKTKIALGTMGALVAVPEGIDKGLAAIETYTGYMQRVRALIDPVISFVTDNAWLIVGAGTAYGVYKLWDLDVLRLRKHQTGGDVTQ
jgi:putative chitinase